ncbi:MAG TPA: hypothetical protein VHC95_02840 [Opitutales bacterium]|nr:hypothetical protein [Opitutales bacterium]
MKTSSLPSRGASRARSLVPATACAVAAALAALLTPAGLLAQQPTVTGYGPGNPPAATTTSHGATVQSYGPRNPAPPVNFGGTTVQGYSPRNPPPSVNAGGVQVSGYNNRANNRPPGRGPFGPPHDVHVVPDSHSGPHFYYGPNHEEFHFVHTYGERHVIVSRDALIDLLAHPLLNTVAWTIGDVLNAELANSLGIPVNTTLYAVAPGTPIVSTLPPGYFVAEAVPANVALVTQGPNGELIVIRRVPPGAFVAYQTSVTGTILNTAIVVPPVQQIVVQAAPTVVVAPPVASAPPVIAAPAAPEGSSSIPLSPKIGKIVYDDGHQPIGVIVLDSDGQQEFIPLTQASSSDAKPADTK